MSSARQMDALTNNAHWLADLDTYVALRLNSEDLVEQQAVIDQLATLPIVEAVYAAPRMTGAHRSPCNDWTPTTFNLEAQQTYLDVPPNTAAFAGTGAPLLPSGIDVRFAWGVPGGTGNLATVIDVESGFLFDHEDLPAISTWGLNIYEQDHGAAVLSIIAGCRSNHGVTGIAHHAAVRHFSPNQGASWSTAAAITAAALQSNPGAVIAVEQQGYLHVAETWNCRTNAPETPVTCDGRWAPAEHWFAEFHAIQFATSLGHIVVEAAGNSGMDLTALGHPRLPQGHVNESGAIMVSGSTSDADDRAMHPTSRFINAGERSDLSAWEDSVVAAGFGNLLTVGGDANQRYTMTFSGTSSATAIVAGAATAFMSMLRSATGNMNVNPYRVRDFFGRVGYQQTAPFVGQHRAGPVVNHGMLANVFRERLVGDALAQGFEQAPEPVATGGNIHAVGVGWGGAIVQNTYRGGAWAGWSTLPGVGGNADWLAAHGAPQSASAEVFLRRQWDGRLLWSRRTNFGSTGSYLSWVDTGITAPPSGIALGTTTTAAITDGVGVSASGALQWFVRPMSVTSVVQATPNIPSPRTLSQVRPIVVSGSGRMDVIAVDSQGRIVHTALTRNPSPAWSAWTELTLSSSALTLDHAVRVGDRIVVVSHSASILHLSSLNLSTHQLTWMMVPLAGVQHAVAVPFSANPHESVTTTTVKIVVLGADNVLRTRTILRSGTIVSEGDPSAPWTVWASHGQGSSLRVTPFQNNTQLVFSLNYGFAMFRVHDAVFPTI
jgi:hypothetical protein